MLALLGVVVPIAVASITAAPTASADAPTVSLKVSNANPPQRIGVQFDASVSGGNTITKYVFNYGDGIQETTYQHLMMHGYHDPGTYSATVTVTDSNGQTAASSPVTVTVRDGLPPAVAITSPRPGQHVHLGHHGVLITGTASDPGPGATGVRSVQLALGFLSTPSSFHGCIWFDGKHRFKVRTCSRPLFFGADLQSNGQFSFRLKARLRWPRGQYGVRVRATDWAGNTSQFYAVKLRTILAFRLSR